MNIILTILVAVMSLPCGRFARDCVDYAHAVDPMGVLGTPGSPRGIAVAGRVAYVADWGAGLQIIDISDPADPLIVASAETPGSPPTSRSWAIAPMSPINAWACT